MIALSICILIACVVYLISKVWAKEDLYRKQIPWILRKVFKATRINGGRWGNSIDFTWGYWSPRLGFRFEVSPSYEDNYLSILLTGFWGNLCIIPKWRPKSWDPDMCVNTAENHRYSINKNEDFFAVQWGKHRKAFRIPFLYSIHLKTVVSEVKHELTFLDYDKEKIKCTYWESVMTFRRMWSPFKYTVRRYNYDFNGKEVGERKGSWKGGTLSGSGFLPGKKSIHVAMRQHIHSKKGVVQCEQL